jgi:hypothetical protein
MDWLELDNERMRARLLEMEAEIAQLKADSNQARGEGSPADDPNGKGKRPWSG